jgi:hypothetical protein
MDPNLFARLGKSKGEKRLDTLARPRTTRNAAASEESFDDVQPRSYS